MRLSQNIPLPELLVPYLQQALPVCRHIWVFQQYDNQAISARSDEGDFDVNSNMVEFLNKSNTGWYADYETPLASGRKISPKGLEDELERDHLLLRDISNAKGTLFLILQIKPESMSTSSYLNSTEKKLYESLIRGFVRSFLNLHDRDKALLQEIARSNENLRKDLLDLKAENEQRTKFFESHMGQILSITIERLEKKYGVSIRYGHDFLKEVMDFKGPLNSIEDVLDKELKIAANLAQLNGETEITLYPSMLTSARIPQKHNEAPVMQLGRYTKTYQLLDRYEKAAEAAAGMGKSIIGRHIGEHCEPSISNAAITDALNKHSRKIYELFQRYPNRWNILRSEFRSVANIIEKETERRKAANL